MQSAEQKPNTIKTTCPYCGVGCGIDVTPTSTLGKVKVVGDKLHPANFGRLCVKGSATGETLDFEGRMLAPQINGEVVDWETALTEVASRFQKTIAEHGPDSVAFYVSGQLLTEDYYVANKLIKGFIGTSNIDTNSRLCMASAVVGYKRAFGSDTVPCSYVDLEQADVITLVGSNAAWAHPVVYQRIAAAKKNNPNMKVVVVDPRRTATCEIADIHLALRPGMDAALFNGLLNYLVTNDAVDTDYIKLFTEGFEDALAAASGQNGIAEVAEQCDVSEQDLAQWFAWFAESRKVVTLYSQGVNQSSSGVDKSNAIINCHLAGGKIGYEGAGPFSITGQPNAMGGREVGGLANQMAAHMDFTQAANVDRVARFWQASNMAKREGLKAVDMFQAVADGKIKAIWIMNTNPAVSMPNADAVKAALQACETVVVSDCMQSTDTTEVADILLPALTWGETSGSVTNSDRTISIQRQFMQGPDLARADWWLICEVAKRMGFASAFDYASPADIFDEHARLSAFENGSGAGQSLRDFDLSALVGLSEEDYLDLKPIQWPVVTKDAQGNPQGTQRMFENGLFFTPNRKARFIPITPMPPKSLPTKDKPFVFNTGRIRDQWHTMTRTAKTGKLMAHRDEPYLSLNPKDADALGLQKDGLVRASNELGVFIGRVEISDAQRPKEVFAPMHWTNQYTSHGKVDILVAPNVDPMSGQPESKHSVVKVEAFNTRWQAVVLSRVAMNMTEITAQLMHATQSSDELYWVKIKGQGFYRYELAGNFDLQSNLQAFQTLLMQSELGHDKQIDELDWMEYEDENRKQIRLACLSDNRLQAVMFIAPVSEGTSPSGKPWPLLSRDWLGMLFEQDELASMERRSLLAGKASGAKDAGKIICSCFSVGFNTIVEAIQNDHLTSVEAIGQALKAGTNCGSCVPELQEILQETLMEVTELV
ncbi:nitrate reductase [Hydrogenovibrio marinus]|uniref:Nitrate reductase n=1 Tax=Hydrogenovibrio marinus TaxID=28885 RepID=A0A066ZPK0_HYDMR|nr:nitrate reductase [Hydrogenovibrio marinus]KDN95457.1 nitrate reductase [Hydrogenovibrio marinus]BBN59947.1 nitrate reductase [Hydrogenovibrio marinus]